MLKSHKLLFLKWPLLESLLKGLAKDIHRGLADYELCVMTDTRWFKYDRDYLCVNKSQIVPVIFEPPCILRSLKPFYQQANVKALPFIFVQFSRTDCRAFFWIQV